MVVVVIDTLRADLLSAYGFERDTSPQIAHLAATGAIFTDAVATSPWTGPSIASILSGRYPDEIGIRFLRHPLPGSVPILPEILRDAGWATGAVVANPIVGPDYGHGRGYDFFHFEYYKTPMTPEDPEWRLEFTADRVTDRALSWLEQAPEPFFLYVHYMDPHDPYLPPAPWRERFASGGADVSELLTELRFTREPLDAEQLAAVRRHYEAEVAFVDAEVGRLLAALPGDAIVLLTGDHGEEFREHGGFLHGHTLYEELLRVPLVLAGPGVPAGRRVEVPVSHVDLAPTLLELVGLAPPPGANGRSLVGLLHDDASAGEDRVLFAVREAGGRRCVAARRGSWKLRTCDPARGVFLSDLASDPRETSNRSGAEGAIAADLVRAIEVRRPRLVPGPDAVDPAQAKRREEALRALGYLR